MNLVQFITDTIKSALEVMLSVHQNEHAIKNKIALQLQKLGLIQAYNNKFKSTGPASCFRGRH